MKKLLKLALYGLGGLIALGLIAILILSESKPEVTPSNEGDQLADKMLVALDQTGWDSLSYLQWNFADRNQYLFDKQRNYAMVTMGDTRVVMDLDQQTGKAYRNDVQLTGDDEKKALEAGWSNWCNDSFWMFAPFKVRDPNTTRSVVDVEGGAHGLMVQYNGGGVTPGDSYLWVLDEKYIPTAYKMWVKIIPIGGTEASWEGWEKLPSGAMVSTSHKIGPMNLLMKDVTEGSTLEELGYDPNLFDL